MRGRRGPELFLSAPEERAPTRPVQRRVTRAAPAASAPKGCTASPVLLPTAALSSISRDYSRSHQSRSLVRSEAGALGCHPEPKDVLIPHGRRAQIVGAMPAGRVPEAVGCLAGKHSELPSDTRQSPGCKTTSRSCRAAAARTMPLPFPSGRRTCSLSPPRHPGGHSPPQSSRTTARSTAPPPTSAGSGGQRCRGPGSAGGPWGRAGAGSPTGTHRRPPPGMLLPDVRCLLRLLFRYK